MFSTTWNGGHIVVSVETETKCSNDARPIAEWFPTHSDDVCSWFNMAAVRMVKVIRKVSLFQLSDVVYLYLISILDECLCSIHLKAFHCSIMFFTAHIYCFSLNMQCSNTTSCPEWHLTHADWLNMPAVQFRD